MQKALIQCLGVRWQNGRSVVQKLDVTPKDPFELLEIRIAGIGLTSIVQDTVGIRHLADGSCCERVGERVVAVVAAGPREFCEAAEDDSLVVGEDRCAIILAARQV